jgi:PAS domain S-box-containing protein
MNMLTESFATKMVDAAAQAVRNSMNTEQHATRFSPPVLLLDADGFIQECGHSIEQIFGYSQHELLWQHISCLFPKLGEVDLIQQGRVNPMLNYICHCDHIFEVINKQGGITVCNLNFFMLDHTGTKNLRLIVRPVAAANS